MTYNYFLRKSTNRNLSLRIGDAFDWLNNLDRVFIGSNIRTCISIARAQSIRGCLHKILFYDSGTYDVNCFSPA